MRRTSIALALMMTCAAAEPCTIVILARKGQVYAAGNEDESNQPELSRHTVRFVPGNAEKKTLGYVAFGYKNNPFSDESGLNEAGLFYDFNALDKLDAPRAGMPKGKFNAIKEMLSTCRTVREAVKYLESYDLPYMSTSQIVIGDASGASAIVERQATTLRARGVDYQIGTNFRTSTTPKTAITCNRYQHCDQILAKKNNSGFSIVQNLLQSTSANSATTKTWYSVICDLKKREVHLFIRGDFTKQFQFSLKDELTKGVRTLDMDEFVKTAASQDRQKQDGLLSKSRR
jgi:hypothetical protein